MGEEQTNVIRALCRHIQRAPNSKTTQSISFHETTTNFNSEPEPLINVRSSNQSRRSELLRRFAAYCHKEAIAPLRIDENK